jgi:hypothetical protein
MTFLAVLTIEGRGQIGRMEIEARSRNLAAQTANGFWENSNHLPPFGTAYSIEVSSSESICSKIFKRTRCKTRDHLHPGLGPPSR